MVFERLPTSVRPLNYQLQLQPYLDELKFDGEEVISLEVKASVDKIILNSREIKIEDAKLQAGDTVRELEVESKPEEEKIVFHLKETVQPGDYKLKLKFTGILNDELRGFYRTRIKLSSGAERNGAITHFEATGARRAFPCFDEPAVRATFDVTLIVPSDRVALSNMPVQSEKPHVMTDWKVVQYMTTPLMPTYLVAFVVGDYDKTGCVDEDGVKIHVYTPQGKSEQGEYAAKVAKTTMPFYKKYFDVPYNLPKLDLVAAPDFPIGAMENWGLVIYREGALLVDPEKTSSAMKEYVALIIGHELAHNWFGNLVTMNWWTHLWLKEGFASWIEYLCVDHCFPEYDIWTQFVSDNLSRALRLDALDSSHPIEVEVGNPTEVDEIFDDISYSKGASIINMLHNYIGDDDFRKGLTSYLQRHQYSSACTEDLWKALEEASGKPVGTMMATWTSQKGFPVLKVTEKQTGNQECVLEITQQKFSASVSKQSGGGSLWSVPVSVLMPSGEVKKVLMEGCTLTVNLKVAPGDWIKVNAGSKGVYRVHYSPDMLTKLVPCLHQQLLGPTDRLGIISDLFALCEVGMVSAVELLNVVKAFTGETNFTVWRDLLTNIAQMGRLLDYTDAHSVFQQFLCALLGHPFSKLGWEDAENEDHLVSKLRELVLTFLGVCGKETVVKQAFAAFNSHVEGQRVLPSNMRRVVYATVMAHGDMDVYSKLKKLHEGADSAEEKNIIAGSFGCTRDHAILQDCLTFSVSQAVRSQDSPVVIGRISLGSPEGRELAWTFFKEHYEVLYKRYSSSTLLARLVKTTTENFTSEDKAVEIEEFFREHPAPSAERTIQQSCEKIRLNAQWLQREAENITKYLTENPLSVPVS